jgi:ribonuclease VapC
VVEYNEVALPASVLVEAGILAARDGKQQQWQRLLASLGASVIPLDEAIAQKAVVAFEQYGKGRHKASLNLGDCLVYATALHLDLPLAVQGP